MSDSLIAAAVFLCLCAASFATMALYPRLRPTQRGDDTNAVVRLVANIFVVMTSLVFGLMINSAKNTFESIDQNVHVFATKLIILDQTLRAQGPAAGEARNYLISYVDAAITDPVRADDALHNEREMTL